MKHNVLLLNAPSDNRYFVSIETPLGILYVASYLRSKGINVSLVDLNAQKNWMRVMHAALNSIKPDIVGISSNFSTRIVTIEIANEIKRLFKDSIIIVGGPQPTIAPEDYHVTSIDYLIPYEGEKVMYDFVKASDKDAVNGVINMKCFNDKSAVVDRRLIDDLDAIPFPAFDMLDLRKYYIYSYRRRPIVSMLTSRGCPQRCIFCSQSVSGRTWRSRSPNNVIEELLWLKNELKVGEVSFSDDNFTFDPTRVHEICELMIAKDCDIVWQTANGIRVTNLTRDLLRLMKKAGCWKIVIAPEVGDNKSLSRIKKDATIEQFQQVAAWCRELGLVYDANFIMGFPFQDKNDLEKIISMAIALKPTLMNLTKLTPFPGTEIHDCLQMQNDINHDVTYYFKSDNRLIELMYKKAYIKFYGRISQTINIIKAIGVRQYWLLFRYAIRVFIKLGLSV